MELSSSGSSSVFFESTKRATTCSCVHQGKHVGGSSCPRCASSLVYSMHKSQTVIFSPMAQSPHSSDHVFLLQPYGASLHVDEQGNTTHIVVFSKEDERTFIQIQNTKLIPAFYQAILEIASVHSPGPLQVIRTGRVKSFFTCNWWVVSLSVFCRHHTTRSHCRKNARLERSMDPQTLW